MPLDGFVSAGVGLPAAWSLFHALGADPSLDGYRVDAEVAGDVLDSLVGLVPPRGLNPPLGISSLSLLRPVRGQRSQFRSELLDADPHPRRGARIAPLDCPGVSQQLGDPRL